MRRWVAALAASAALGATAAEPSRWYLQVDNDVFYGSDRWYTSGVRIARVAPRGDHELEWGLLQEIYTPEAKRHNPIDRPPAARLLATVARHDRMPDSWRTLELDLGVTGPGALGRQAQDFIHRFVPAPDEEWDKQRSNRLDVQAIAVRSQTLVPLADFARIKAHYGVVLGNQVAFGHGTLELRFGRGAAAQMSSPVLRFAATPPWPQGASARGWSAFVAAGVRGVWRNRTLDPRPDEGPGIRREPSVFRFSTGVTWLHKYGALTFVMARDEREFVGQRAVHGFGSVVVEMPF